MEASAAQRGFVRREREEIDSFLHASDGLAEKGGEREEREADWWGICMHKVSSGVPSAPREPGFWLGSPAPFLPKSGAKRGCEGLTGSIFCCRCLKKCLGGLPEGTDGDALNGFAKCSCVLVNYRVVFLLHVNGQ